MGGGLRDDPKNGYEGDNSSIQCYVSGDFLK